MYEH